MDIPVTRDTSFLLSWVFLDYLDVHTPNTTGFISLLIFR